jgi:hypothetical protein
MLRVDLRATGPDATDVFLPETAQRSDRLGEVGQTARLQGSRPRPFSGQTPVRVPPMTTLPLAFNRRRPRVGNRVFPHRFLVMLCVGVGTGTLVALGLYVTKPAYVALLPLGFAVLLPTLFLKNFRMYWFVIFLLSLQFTISKNLNDGLAVVDALQIDYTIDNFTFEITATDLALLMLLAIWANDCMFHRRPLRFPPVTWLAVGYLGVALLSTVVALVSLSRNGRDIPADQVFHCLSVRGQLP